MIVGSVTLQDTATSPEPRVQNTRRVVDHDVPARSLFAQVHDADGAAPRPAVQGTGHFDVFLEACEQELRAEGELSSLGVPAPEWPVETVEDALAGVDGYIMPHPEDLTGGEPLGMGRFANIGRSWATQPLAVSDSTAPPDEGWAGRADGPRMLTVAPQPVSVPTAIDGERVAKAARVDPGSGGASFPPP
jgi:hypothetical protein